MSLVQQASIVNPQNAHFRDPGMSSKVGAVSGCGAGDSALSLQQKGLYQMFKTGGRGKKHSKSRRRKYKGGNGFGFSKDQVIAGTSGVNGNGSVHLAGFSRYQNTGQNAITNMNASKQSGGSSSGYSYGTGGYPFYSYKPSPGENLSVFAGSGYPPISRGLNSQCGGKRRKSRKGTKKRKGSKKRKSVKRRQRGGTGQFMNNIANSHIYSTGAPPGLDHTASALANPPPYTPKNDCLNTWKHLGDTPPYNEVYM